MTGRVVHFEVPFDDADRARDFYREVFGWQIQSMPEMNYNMVSTGPTERRGHADRARLHRRRDDAAPGTGQLAGDHDRVDDIDATLVAIEKHGGAAVGEKMAVGDMGFAAYFSDSEGNLHGSLAERRLEQLESPAGYLAGMQLEQGQVAVVTGAGSGIGLALADRLARAGLNLVLADVQEDALAAAAETVASHGVDVAHRAAPT